jgi:deoxyribodipyrimidine photo-lyase
MPKPDSALVWFRRDLRDYDHAALHHALEARRRVYCAFVFDTEILDALEDRCDRRVDFIWRCVAELDARLRERGGGLILRHGRARQEIVALARELGVAEVHANRDYEPQARDRDATVARALAAAGIAFRDHKDQVIFEVGEVLTRSGHAFSVFTPYKNAWLARLQAPDVAPYGVRPEPGQLAPPHAAPQGLTLHSLGFEATDLDVLKLSAGMTGARQRFADFVARIDEYAARRDYPALKGPSYLSVHLRFGTVSIRELAAFAWQQAQLHGSAGAAVWLDELIWRDFYHMILAQHPRVVDHAFRPAFDAIQWEDAPELFAAWCEGRTGYPLVDAAMRQLNRSGYMHNRLRMLTASFLTKDLGIDWRRGERYFARRLNDYDLAANNGGWQWAASTGCDAQPWFRIFNPVTQSQKFDAQGTFIRRYVPELAGCTAKQIHAPWCMSAEEQRAAGVVIGRDYPPPIVDHAIARQRTLERYGRVRRDG